MICSRGCQSGGKIHPSAYSTVIERQACLDISVRKLEGLKDVELEWPELKCHCQSITRVKFSPELEALELAPTCLPVHGIC